jgi:CHASE2 domain-containing sensor protein
VILSVSVLVHLLHQGIWFSPFETAALDSLLLQKQPKEAHDIIVVGINDSDYEELFKSRSPLDPGQLQALLEAIARGHPSLIGVDIDTSDPQFRGLAAPQQPPVVWAQDAQFDIDGQCECFGPLPVLGGLNPGLLTGIALMPRDADGLLRSYRRRFHTPVGWIPSFASRLVSTDHRKLREGRNAGNEQGEELILDFAGDRYRFPRLNATDVLNTSKSLGWSERNRGPLWGKIVLLGGSYRAARDEYMTPLGVMSGLDLTALATESELEGGGIKPVNQVVLAGLEILASILLVWIHWRLPLIWALVGSLLAIPLAAFAASALVFQTLAYWMNAVPLFAAVLIHQLYEYAVQYREMYLKLVRRSRTDL